MTTVRITESRLKVSDFKLQTLLEITNAINNNLPAEQLFILFQFILQQQLQIGKAMVFLQERHEWHLVLSYGMDREEEFLNVEEELLPIKEITVVDHTVGKSRHSFDVVIPVYHQTQVLAYLLLGDIDEQALKPSPIIKHLTFIQTLANIIAVSVENQRLIQENYRQERLKKELELAREMQRMLFPKRLPNNSRIQVAAYYQPHQQVGGDYYDLIEQGGRECYICLADVSGKGISAGLLMANFQASLRTIIQYNNSLPEIAEKLNATVWENAGGEKYITFFICRYNYSSRELHYINAAHPAPLLLSSKEEISRLDKGCPGLGMFEELPFVVEGKMVMDENSILLCYTDGVNELENENDEPFSEAKIMDQLRSNAQGTMHDLNRGMLKALNQFRGKKPFADDIALVSCRFF